MNDLTERYKRMYQKDMQRVFTDLEKQDHEALSQLLEEYEQFKGTKHND